MPMFPARSRDSDHEPPPFRRPGSHTLLGSLPAVIDPVALEPAALDPAGPDPDAPAPTALRIADGGASELAVAHDSAPDLAAAHDSAPAVLVIGSAHDVPAIGAFLARLPEALHCSVYIEAASPIQRRQLPERQGTSVSWLFRGAVAGQRPGKGQRLLVAMRAWLAEWLLEDAPPPLVWAGASDCPRLTPSLTELEQQLGRMR